jgi:endonuclease G, mitochondrial
MGRCDHDPIHAFFLVPEPGTAVRPVGRLEHRRIRHRAAQPHRYRIHQGPHLPEGSQVGNELYSGNRLDRGHVARRADLLWGGLAEAGQANEDSFYYTNITPQMDDFNQSSRDGLGGRLEDALYEDVDVDDLRVSVFGGPVFHDDDRIYRDTALPREYWKLVAFTEARVLKARAFLLTQDLDQLRAIPSLDKFRVYQITLAELEGRTILQFPTVLHQAGQPLERGPKERQPLETTADITC